MLTTTNDRRSLAAIEKAQAPPTILNEMVVEFDESALAEMEEDCGASAFAQIMRKCAESAQTNLALLEAAVAKRDRDEIARLVHKMKGLFAQFGAKRAAELAVALNTASQGRLDEAIALFRLSALRACERFLALSK